MNKNVLMVFTLFLTIKILSLLEFELLSIFLMITLILIYLSPKSSFISVLLLLEMMVLNLFIFFILNSGKSGLDHWNLFLILVFSASEASVGLAILVYLSRSWGETLKIAKFY